jgi:hypothetical protein
VAAPAQLLLDAPRTKDRALSPCCGASTVIGFLSLEENVMARSCSRCGTERRQALGAEQAPKADTGLAKVIPLFGVRRGGP